MGLQTWLLLRLPCPLVLPWQPHWPPCHVSSVQPHLLATFAQAVPTLLHVAHPDLCVFFMCMSVLSACMSVRHLHVWCLMRPEEGTGVPESGVTDVWEPEMESGSSVPQVHP